jgi:hypothetical protein
MALGGKSAPIFSVTWGLLAIQGSLVGEQIKPSGGALCEWHLGIRQGQDF